MSVRFQQIIFHLPLISSFAISTSDSLRRGDGLFTSTLLPFAGHRAVSMELESSFESAVFVTVSSSDISQFKIVPGARTLDRNKIIVGAGKDDNEGKSRSIHR